MATTLPNVRHAPTATWPSGRPKKQLKIILQVTDYPPDRFVSSLGLYAQALASALADKGHEIHVLTRGGNGQEVERQGNITVYRLTRAPTVYLDEVSPLSLIRYGLEHVASEWRYRKQVAAKMVELIETRGIDLIEVADASAEAVLYNPKDYPHIPFIVRMHGPMTALDRFDTYIPPYGRPFIRFVERQLPLKATHLTAPSEAARALFCEALGLGGKEVRVLPNIPTLVGDPEAPALARDPNLVLFVGRLIPTKGVHLLLKAIPEVLKARPQTRFVFVGGDGPATKMYNSYREHLLSLVPKDCHHALSFEGYRPPEEVGAFYEQAAVCVIPSLFESFCYVCLEAMMHGAAIVASPTGAMADMLEGGRCGLLFEPPDTGALAKGLLRLLSDPELRLRLGDAAKQRAFTHYHPNAVAAEIMDFYEEALAATLSAVPAQ